MTTVRWYLAVSADTDQALRVFLANQRGERKGDKRTGLLQHEQVDRIRNVTPAMCCSEVIEYQNVC